MNHVITIPKKIAQSGDLVLVPRTEYEAMRRSLRERSVPLSENNLDVDIEKSLAEYRAGKYFGPFDTVDELIRSLKGRQKRKKHAL